MPKALITYEVCDGIPVPAKQRRPKVPNDLEIAHRVIAELNAGTEKSKHRLVDEELKASLNDNELEKFDTHHRRIIRRVNLMLDKLNPGLKNQL